MLKRLSIALVIVLSQASFAEVIGQYGNVWEIAEPDAVTEIKTRLKEMEKDGSLKKFEDEQKRHALDGIENPAPIQGITTAMASTTRYIDPTYTASRDIGVPGERPFIKKGMTYNPLSYGGLKRRYVFIDARDQRQVDLALKDVKDFPRDKVILTGGSWTRLDRKYHVSFYFDQGGYITKRLGITKVPAILSQSGMLLKIEEVAP